MLAAKYTIERNRRPKAREACHPANWLPEFLPRGRIETIPRRGYRFMGRLADVQLPVAVPPLAEQSIGRPEQGNTPPSSSDSAVLVGQTGFVSTKWRLLLLAAAAALALFSTALLLHRGSSAKGTGQPRIKSLAVLPLKNLSADPAQEYLADGMTEALIDASQVSMISASFLAPRSCNIKTPKRRCRRLPKHSA